jgi:retron-type reverse transcriptase
MFERNLEQHIFQLHRDLKSKHYQHGSYKDFFISDPKRRHIHKATVRDRVLHHAIFQVLNPVFDPTLISSSFSCRIGKGTHKGVAALRSMLRKESRNNTRSCYVLKCDVRKFFDSIDHDILMTILRKKIKDLDTLWLLETVIESYTSVVPNLFQPRRQGVPIGNLTSQLFANVYMNELDQFIKHGLKVRYYARYTDDLVIVSMNREYLAGIIPKLNDFLREKLRLEFHPAKVNIHYDAKGVDFLGYLVFPHHLLVRRKTQRRIIRRLQEKLRSYRQRKIERQAVEGSLRSYLGVLSHANTHNLSNDLKNYFWFTLGERESTNWFS